MKILIVSSFFPPENSIASLRPYSWAKWWSRAGHEVTMLTTTKFQQPNSLKLDCSEFTVVEVPLKIPFKNAYLKNKESVEKSTEENLIAKLSIKQRIIEFFKNEYVKFTKNTGCFYACRFPDWHDGWIKQAAKQLRPSCCDLLVTTGGPYSVHLTASLLKKKGWKGKWILDWRDLWTRNHLYQGLKIFHPYEKYLEKKFHSNADYITTVSEPLAETLREMTKTPVATIYNGFDSEDFEFLFSRARKETQKYTIAYLGTVYRRYQDPEPLFQGLGELDKAGLITPDDITVCFAGGQADVKDLAQKYGAEKYYTYLGFLPREQSLELQCDSDSVLFLEYENPEVKGVLTGKLFEYLYLSRNIMAVGCSNKTSAGELIEKCNAGICFAKDVEKIKQFILCEIEKKKNGTLELSQNKKNIEEINFFSRKLQAQKMLELVNKSTVHLRT